MTKHLFSIVAIAALVCAIACSKGSDPGTSTSRLVGTWEHDMSREPAFAKMASEHGIDPQELLRKTREENPPMRLTFTGDGKHVMEGAVLGHTTHDESTWSIASEVGDRVTIEVHAPGKPTESMIYTFVEPDLIRSEDRLTGGMMLRRVK